MEQRTDTSANDWAAHTRFLHSHRAEVLRLLPAIRDRFQPAYLLVDARASRASAVALLIAMGYSRDVAELYTDAFVSMAAPDCTPLTAGLVPWEVCTVLSQAREFELSSDRIPAIFIGAGTFTITTIARDPWQPHKDYLTACADAVLAAVHGRREPAQSQAVALVDAATEQGRRIARYAASAAGEPDRGSCQQLERLAETMASVGYPPLFLQVLPRRALLSGAMGEPAREAAIACGPEYVPIVCRDDSDDSFVTRFHLDARGSVIAQEHFR